MSLEPKELILQETMPTNWLNVENEKISKPMFSLARLQRFIDTEKIPTPHDYKLACSYNFAMFAIFELRADTWRYVAYIPSYQTIVTPKYEKGLLERLTQPCDDKTHLVTFHLLQENFRWMRKA